MNLEIIGKNLKAFRGALGFNQEQVANYLKIKREVISYYENGERQVPIPVLMKLADLYGVSVKEILEENPKQSILNEAFAFRAENIANSDLEVIASFKRIAKNYVSLKEKEIKND